MKRYYYKSATDGHPAYNLKSPLSDTTGYIEITEAEWNELTYVPPYVPTEADNIRNEISKLKAQLLHTDYVVIKIAEGSATAEEYAEVIANRKLWRARINELEAQL